MGPISNDISSEELFRTHRHTLIESLGIEFLPMTDGYLRATMPVDERTIQPMGLLHGGSSVALAETLGSVCTYYLIDRERQYSVGLAINANHIRPAKSGVVTGVAKPIHLGRTTHIWEINITNDMGKLVCVSRLTMAIRDK